MQTYRVKLGGRAFRVAARTPKQAVFAARALIRVRA